LTLLCLLTSNRFKTFTTQASPVTRILITAFEPYERWAENSSWLALCDLTRWYDGDLELVTRRYPVDLSRLSESLSKDLQGDFPLVIHLGQAPGSTHIQLEAIGLNVFRDGSKLIDDGPEAYRSNLPIETCASKLREAGIPCRSSYHAGTYLCNAALYLNHHYTRIFGMQTESIFIHLPLSPTQAVKDETHPASMSTPMASAAVAIVMQSLAVASDKKST